MSYWKFDARSGSKATVPAPVPSIAAPWISTRLMAATPSRRVPSTRPDAIGNSAQRRRGERGRGVDGVVGERRRAHEQLANRRAQAPRAREARLKSRVVERHGRVDVREAAVVRDGERAAVDVDRHVGVGQRAAEHVGAREAAAAGKRELRRARARALDVEPSAHGAAVPRLAQPADVEPVAETIEVEAIDGRRRR